MPSLLIDHDCYLRLAKSRDFLAVHQARHSLIADAARMAGISLHHYIRLYARAFGETPQEFVIRQRLATAQRLLRGGSLSITEVCFEVGYESLGSFSSLFRRAVGVSPREYRRLWSFPGAALLFSVPFCFSQLWSENAKFEKNQSFAFVTLASEAQLNDSKTLTHYPLGRRPSSG